MLTYNLTKSRLHLWITFSGPKRKLQFYPLSCLHLDLYSEKYMSQLVQHVKGGRLNIWECPSSLLLLLFFFFPWTADASSSSVLRRSAVDSSPHSFHHVTPLSTFGGLGLPSWVLLFGGMVPGGVENAASHGGRRYRSQKQRSFPAVLPRSSGETQLPQRSHLCLVGFFLHGHCGGLGFLFYPFIAAVQKVNGI